MIVCFHFFFNFSQSNKFISKSLLCTILSPTRIRNNKKSVLSSYFYKLILDNTIFNKKMILISIVNADKKVYVFLKKF